MTPRQTASKTLRRYIKDLQEHAEQLDSDMMDFELEQLVLIARQLANYGEVVLRQRHTSRYPTRPQRLHIVA